MRKFIGVIFCALFNFITLSGIAVAGETGHYVNGVEGIKGASLPPPGFYWRIYNVYYHSDLLTDKDGDEANVGLDLNVYGLTNRFIWISDMKFLGADYGADVIIPLVYTDIEIKALGLEDDVFGLADIAVEPIVLS